MGAFLLSSYPLHFLYFVLACSPASLEKETSMTHSDVNSSSTTEPIAPTPPIKILVKSGFSGVGSSVDVTSDQVHSVKPSSSRLGDKSGKKRGRRSA